MVLAFTFRSFTSTLFPVRTIGMFSQTRTKSPKTKGQKFSSHMILTWIELTVPVGNILVGNARGNIEHNDATLSVDVVSVTKTSEFLLSCGVPDVELDITQVLRSISILQQPCRACATGS